MSMARNGRDEGIGRADPVDRLWSASKGLPLISRALSLRLWLDSCPTDRAGRSSWRKGVKWVVGNAQKRWREETKRFRLSSSEEKGNECGTASSHGIKPCPMHHNVRDGGVQTYWVDFTQSLGQALVAYHVEKKERQAA